jgi:hypothetical protein
MMNREKAIEVLGEPDVMTSKVHQWYVDSETGQEGIRIYLKSEFVNLDGVYSLEQLKALVWWINLHSDITPKELHAYEQSQSIDESMRKDDRSTCGG